MDEPKVSPATSSSNPKSPPDLDFSQVAAVQPAGASAGWSDLSSALGKAVLRPLRSVERIIEDPLPAIGEGLGRALKREALRSYRQETAGLGINAEEELAQISAAYAARPFEQMTAESRGDLNGFFDPFSTLRISHAGTFMYLEPLDDRSGAFDVRVKFPSGNKVLDILEGDRAASDLWKELDARFSYSFSPWDEVSFGRDGDFYFIGFCHAIGSRSRVR